MTYLIHPPDMSHHVYMVSLIHVFVSDMTHSGNVRSRRRDILGNLFRFLSRSLCLSLSLSFLDGYCSTVQGLLDWFEVDLGFTELLFIQIDLCVMCVFDLYSPVSLSLSLSPSLYLFACERVFSSSVLSRFTRIHTRD